MEEKGQLPNQTERRRDLAQLRTRRHYVLLPAADSVLRGLELTEKDFDEILLRGLDEKEKDSYWKLFRKVEESVRNYLKG